MVSALAGNGLPEEKVKPNRIYAPTATKHKPSSDRNNVLTVADGVGYTAFVETFTFMNDINTLKRLFMKKCGNGKVYISCIRPRIKRMNRCTQFHGIVHERVHRQPLKPQ